MANGHADGPWPRAFLSYSRKDKEFVESLASSLTARGFVADWDQASTDCCELLVKDFLATGDSDAPSQLRADGCREIPPSTRYEPLRPRSNPFASMLVSRSRALEAKMAAEDPSGG